MRTKILEDKNREKLIRFDNDPANNIFGLKGNALEKYNLILEMIGIVKRGDTKGSNTLKDIVHSKVNDVKDKSELDHCLEKLLEPILEVYIELPGGTNNILNKLSNAGFNFNFHSPNEPDIISKTLNYYESAPEHRRPALLRIIDTFLSCGTTPPQNLEGKIREIREQNRFEGKSVEMDDFEIRDDDNKKVPLIDSRKVRFNDNMEEFSDNPSPNPKGKGGNRVLIAPKKAR